MKIIGFGHRRYAGKDTASDFAITHIRANKRGMLAIKTGFSSKMKAIANDLYRWAGLQEEQYYEDHPELKDVILQKIGKSPREVWIEIGTTVGRAIYKDTWIDYTVNKKCDYLFIKDLRFPNEADRILQSGGLVFRVDNPRIEKFNDVADTALEGYQNWSDVVINDCDLATFNKRVIALLEKHNV